MGPLMGHCGKFREAVQHLERAIDLYDPVQNRNSDSLSGVGAKSHTPAVLFRRFVCSVYPARALATAREAVAHAEKLDQPYSLAFALVWQIAVLFTSRRRSTGV
jgi:hypothetical protein